MRMITGCPACGTLFKVVPDQLKVSDGWVRCGHCGEVFDAASRLQAETPVDSGSLPVPSEPARTPAPLDGPAADAPAGLATPERAAPTSAPASDVSPPAPVRAAPLAAPDVPVAAPRPAPVDAGADSAPAAAPLSLASDLDSGYLREVEALRAATSATEPEEPDLPRGAAEPEADDVSFVRQARRRAFWRRTPVRLGLAMLALALSAGLAAQIGVQQRDRLAAQWPQLRPVLQTLCDWHGCALGPWRQIEALAIDSSGFTRLRADTYRLSVVLRNQAALPVAMPHLELTLTDAQDQPLVRRVLSPRDLGTAADALAAGAEWNGGAALSVTLAAATGRVAGYRLLAFYP